MNIGKVVVFLAVLILLFSCTEKHNIIGYQNQNIGQDSLNVNLSDYNLSYYTSQDTSSNYSENTILTIGNYTFDNTEVKSYALLKFPDTPDTISTISNLEFDINFYDVEKLQSSNIKIAKITKDWMENEVSFTEASTDSTWIFTDNFVDINIEKIATNVSENDSLLFSQNEMDLSELENLIKTDWANDENYGILLYSDDSDSHFQIYSSENYSDSLSTFIPHLKFSYNTENCPDSAFVYDKNVSFDTNVINNPTTVDTISSRMIISNAHIKRTVLKFDISSLTDTLLEKTTIINKAELIFSNIDNYNPNISWTLYPYLISVETPEQPMQYNEDYEFLSNTVLTNEDFDDNGEISINVSSIIQSLISEQNENYGIVIKSTKENKDFGFIEFSHDVKLKITYTNPDNF